MTTPPDFMSRLLARQSVADSKSLPFVSVVTPTWNRREFLPYLLYMFQYQDYPADRRELVILDDSPQSNADLITSFQRVAPCAKAIRYYHLSERLTLGEKRNRLNRLAQGEYIICMDDDDYYPADKLSYTIKEMRRHNAVFAGCDRIPVWYSHINRVYMSASFGPNHALNGTFAYHRNFLKKHRYDSEATLSEEQGFLNDFTCPVLQLDPQRSILCVSHHANTFDKDFIMSSCDDAPQQLDDIVSDSHLRRFYQRLRQAPVRTSINWSFFERILINPHQTDCETAERCIDALVAQGVSRQQITLLDSAVDQPAVYSHLQAAQKARQAGWQNYLLLDARVHFVRQEKTVKNLNQLLAACQALPWDVLLLGCALERGQPLQALPGAVRVTAASQPVAYAVNQPRYPEFIAMLQQTLAEQQVQSDNAACQQNLLWQPLAASGRWLALYPSYAWLDVDPDGRSLAHNFFRKLTPLNDANQRVETSL